MKSTSVLIVEDDSAWQEILSETIASLGYVYETASSSKHAIDKLKKDNFNIAMLDIRLSDTDSENNEGLEVLKWLVDNNKSTKVVIVSAYASSNRMRNAFDSGKVADWLLKQEFSISTFYTCIKGIVDEPPISSAG